MKTLRIRGNATLNIYDLDMKHVVADEEELTFDEAEELLRDELQKRFLHGNFPEAEVDDIVIDVQKTGG